MARPSFRRLLSCAALVCVAACARSPLEDFDADASFISGDGQRDAGGRTNEAEVPDTTTDTAGSQGAVRTTDAGGAPEAGRATDAGPAPDTADARADQSPPTATNDGSGDAGTSVSTPSDSGASQTPPSVPDPMPTPVPPAPDAGTVTPVPATDLCKLNAYDIAILGDSVMRLSGDFTRYLQNKARAAGVLGPSETYVDVSQTFASMNGSPGIPGQYTSALAESKRRGGTGPKLVIMTGGGQDVLIDNRTCLNPKSVDEVAKNAACVGVVDKVLATAQRLIDTGVASGSRAAIYFFYPNLPENSLAGGANGNNVLNYAAPRAKAFCEGQTKAPCYFIDMRPPFEDASNPGHPRAGLIGFDGVNPTALGSQILADEVWKMMETHCLGVKK